MKARVKTSSPERVLTCALDDVAGMRLSSILQGLAIEERRISPDEWGQDVGYLAGFTGYREKEAPAAPLSCGGVMVMCGLSEARMNALLKALKEHEIRVPLKAVVTAANQNWSFARLVEELNREHQAFTQGRRR